ncbi:MAG: hypothetical protein RIR12_2446 [Bacteroidota bacterium]|jgi:hypothetical protein
MKKIVIILTVLLFVQNTIIAQFRYKGYKGILVENNNKPDFVTYDKDNKKNDEYYTTWQPHYLLVQIASYFGNQKVFSISEYYIHYEDLSDEYIDKKIAEGDNAITEEKRGGQWGYIIENDEKKLVSYNVEFSTTGQKVTINTFRSDADFEGNYWRTIRVSFGNKADAQGFFKKFKEKKWDAMLDLSDAPKRVYTIYDGIEQVRYGNDPSKDEPTVEEETEAATSSSSNTEPKNATSKEVEKIKIEFQNKGDEDIYMIFENNKGQLGAGRVGRGQISSYYFIPGAVIKLKKSGVVVYTVAAGTKNNTRVQL